MQFLICTLTGADPDLTSPIGASRFLLFFKGWSGSLLLGIHTCCSKELDPYCALWSLVVGSAKFGIFHSNKFITF